MTGAESPADGDRPRESALGAREIAPRTTPRWQLWLAAALLVAHGVLAWTIRSYGVSTRDQANYILLARSLRHWRYVDSFLLGEPAHALYPPAYPSFLAVLSLPFGEHLDLFIAANVVASIVALGLLYDAMRRRIRGEAALAALALAALNPSVALFAGMPLSETPYMLVSTVALWAILREPTSPEARGSRPWLWPVLAGSAAMCAALTRSAGVSILAAVFMYWLLERQFRRAATLLVASSLTVGSWLLWTTLAPANALSLSYGSDVVRELSPKVGLLRALAVRVSANVIAYPSATIPSVLPQPSLAGTTIDNIVGFFVLLVVAAAGAVVLWKHARVLSLYLVAYAAVLVAWPWNETRFLVPIVPIVLCLIMGGAFSVVGARRWLRPTPLLIVAIVAGTAAFKDWSAVKTSLRCDRAHATTSETCLPVERLDFLTAMRFVRQAIPRDAAILTGDDALIGYYGDRRTLPIRIFADSSANALLAVLHAHGVRYVLLSPQRSPRVLRLDVWKERCTELSTVKEFPATTLLLYLPPVGTPPPVPNACADIQRYSRSAINAALWSEAP